MKWLLLLPLLMILPLSANASLQFDYSNSTQAVNYDSMTLDQFFGPHNIHVNQGFMIVINDNNEHTIKVQNTTNLIDPTGGAITYFYNDREYHLAAADLPMLAFPYIGEYNVTDADNASNFGIFNVVDKSVDLSSLPLPEMPQPLQFTYSNSTQNTTQASDSQTTKDSTSQTNSQQTTPPENTTVTTSEQNSTTQQPVQQQVAPTITNNQPLDIPTITMSQSVLDKSDYYRQMIGLPLLETVVNVIIQG